MNNWVTEAKNALVTRTKAAVEHVSGLVTPQVAAPVGPLAPVPVPVVNDNQLRRAIGADLAADVRGRPAVGGGGGGSMLAMRALQERVAKPSLVSRMIAATMSLTMRVLKPSLVRPPIKTTADLEQWVTKLVSTNKARFQANIAPAGPAIVPVIAELAVQYGFPMMTAGTSSDNRYTRAIRKKLADFAHEAFDAGLFPSFREAQVAVSRIASANGYHVTAVGVKRPSNSGDVDIILFMSDEKFKELGGLKGSSGAISGVILQMKQDISARTGVPIEDVDFYNQYYDFPTDKSGRYANNSYGYGWVVDTEGRSFWMEPHRIGLTKSGMVEAWVPEDFDQKTTASLRDPLE